MLSIDTNILLYALNEQAPENAAARQFLSECGARSEHLHTVPQQSALGATRIGASDESGVATHGKATGGTPENF